LAAGVVEWGEADLVELRGARHSSTYADPATMPTGPMVVAVELVNGATVPAAGSA
jgi:hypothetical protein